jgi:hypothetical protein
MKSQTKYLLDDYNLSDSITWNQVDNLIPKDQILQHIDEFLLNLKSNHQLPGSVYMKLISIGDWYRQHGFITQRQYRYVTLAIVSYWNEVREDFRQYF